MLLCNLDCDDTQLHDPSFGSSWTFATINKWSLTSWTKLIEQLYNGAPNITCTWWQGGRSWLACSTAGISRIYNTKSGDN